MKNIFKITLFLLAIGTVSCDKEEPFSEIDDVNLSSSPLENMIVDLLAESKNALPGSLENPIDVPEDAFIDFVDYEFEICDGDGSVFSYKRSQGQFYRGTYGNGVIPALPAAYQLTDNGCVEFVFSGTKVNEFEIGRYYLIHGEVVARSSFTLGIENNFGFDEGFWFKVLPDSDQVQKVTFFADGTKEFGEIVDPPYELNIDCTQLVAYDTIDNVPTSILRMTGEKFVLRSPRDVGRPEDFRPLNAVYTGELVDIGLFQYYAASFVGICGTENDNPVIDPCEGVPPFNFFTRYDIGDQVTFRGYLFTKIRRGWRREALCL